jgi:hypothetical protein
LFVVPFVSDCLYKYVAKSERPKGENKLK